MDVSEVEENLFSIGDAKLHGGMCKILSDVYSRVLNIFPAIEAARPRSRSGIQALCSLHIALEKAKTVLQHCSECSKLYLAITADSVLSKFEKAKSSLIDSLRSVEHIVPQTVGCQILEIVCELEGTTFSLDPEEKQVGDDIVTLLQKGRRLEDSCTENNELECFHQAATKLGINSSRAALAERRALKKLIERARMDEDKRKEAIVAYLLHLMRKYSKLFRIELGDDTDSQGSTPCSPTVSDAATNSHAFDRHLSKLSSFNFRPSLSFKQNDRGKSGHISVPPEELRCPISLQLMYDPVIISSGQTYERVCIEKWFDDGHDTCPKTQQKLSHLGLTPNYCVKGLIASWCEQHGVHVPDSPPESLDLNYWRLALSDTESSATTSKPVENSKLSGVKVVPLEESDTVDEAEDNEAERDVKQDQESTSIDHDMYDNFLKALNGEHDLRKKCIVVEKIRRLLKDDEEARVYMGAHGFVEALVQFLKSAVDERSELAKEVGAMALFNIAVNNNRNKEILLSAGLVPLLEQMILEPESQALVAALSLNLSCLEEAKPTLGSSKNTIIPFLINLLQGPADPQSKLDALHTIFNLSTYTPNIPNLLRSGVIAGLHTHLKEPRNTAWSDKSIAVLINVASTRAGKQAVVSDQSVISELTTILDVGEPIEQEQAASCLLVLCSGNDSCTDMVLQEGVIPSLVCLSVNGTARSKDKAQKLLMLFREQRQPDLPPPPPPPRPVPSEPQKTITSSEGEPRPLGKSSSTRMLGRTFSFFRRGKPLSSRK